MDAGAPSASGGGEEKELMKQDPPRAIKIISGVAIEVERSGAAGGLLQQIPASKFIADESPEAAQRRARREAWEREQAEKKRAELPKGWVNDKFGGRGRSRNRHRSGRSSEAEVADHGGGVLSAIDQIADGDDKWLDLVLPGVVTDEVFE